MGDDGVPHGSGGGGGGGFPVGSLVEVMVNEEDMGGVYFSATVIPLPRKRNTRNSGEGAKLHVKYHNLLARAGGEERLREYVDVSTVRPAPPLLLHDPAKPFHPGDVVDAFYTDGWWRGVVRSVVGAGDRFLVTFDCPPDEQEFGPAALRAHWDWADGVWAKQADLANLVFEVGAKVEISIAQEDDDDHDHDYKSVWFPAAIVAGLGNGAYSVEFKDKKGGCVTAEVDSANVRPSPPIFKNSKFRASERVDAFFDFGWWNGLIKKKAHKNGYIVFFEKTNLNKLFKPSELRPHVDWKDGKWFLTDAAAAAKGKCSPCLHKHKPQIEDANQENEEEYDRERRSKRMEDENQENEEEYNRERRSKKREDANQEISEGEEECDRERSSKRMEDGNQENEEIDEGEEEECDRERRSKRAEDAKTPAPIDGEKWPFVKQSPIWKAVESMEVLKSMPPQRPHFKPLRRFGKSAREGLAVGCMVSLCNAVEASRGLKFGDPKRVVDDLHRTLQELETHGFEVGAVKGRVAELAAAKEEEEKLVGRARGIEEEMEEHTQRRRRIEWEMRAMDGHIGRLQEQLQIAGVAKAKEVQEIGRLQGGLEETKMQLERLKSEFDGVAASMLLTL